MSIVYAREQTSELEIHSTTPRPPSAPLLKSEPIILLFMEEFNFCKFPYCTVPFLTDKLEKLRTQFSFNALGWHKPT